MERRQILKLPEVYPDPREASDYSAHSNSEWFMDPSFHWERKSICTCARAHWE